MEKKIPQIQTSYIKLDLHKCKACWRCIETCPKHVFGKINLFFHKHVILKNNEMCIECSKCIKVCTFGAIAKIS